MQWNQSYDYHGSRSYEVAEPKVRKFRLLLSWMAFVARRKLRELNRRPPPVVLFDGAKKFTLIGAEVPQPANDGPTEGTLAARRASAHDEHDWRVLP